MVVVKRKTQKIVSAEEKFDKELSKPWTIVNAMRVVLERRTTWNSGLMISDLRKALADRIYEVKRSLKSNHGKRIKYKLVSEHAVYINKSRINRFRVPGLFIGCLQRINNEGITEWRYFNIDSQDDATEQRNIFDNIIELKQSYEENLEVHMTSEKVRSTVRPQLTNSARVRS